jgi:hypothetical protein
MEPTPQCIPLPGGRGIRRCRASAGRGQATVEFAFMAPLFFLCFFAAIDAGLWAIQTSAAVSAAEQGARLAASAAGTPQSGDTPSPQVLFAAVRNQLRQAMFGTAHEAACTEWDALEGGSLRSRPHQSPVSASRSRRSPASRSPHTLRRQRSRHHARAGRSSSHRGRTRPRCHRPS